MSSGYINLPDSGLYPEPAACSRSLLTRLSLGSICPGVAARRVALPCERPRGNDKLKGGPGTLYGGPGHDRIFDRSGENNRIYVGDGEQGLVCVNRGSGEIVTYDPKGTFISSRSC